MKVCSGVAGGTNLPRPPLPAAIAMPLTLTPLVPPAAGPLTIDLAGVVPDRVRHLDIPSIARLTISADERPCQLGECFAVAGAAADGRIECRGDFSRVQRLGAGMSEGRIDVFGSVGRHAAAAMTGGTLTITGHAGDWLAAEMTGGEVHVAGDTGDHAAAALPGSERGMRGGLVLVGGAAGCLAGARMRRGILAIAGDCGPAVAFEMRAGTVLVGGRVGLRPAVGMRRGSLIALATPPDLPPGFTRGARWMPAFLPLLLRRLEGAGWPADRSPSQPPIQQPPFQQWHGDRLSGDQGSGGRGEVWTVATAGHG
jgi:formylmethanofuran dehydrogenase subunit C